MHTYTLKCIHARFLSRAHTLAHTQEQTAKTVVAAAAQDHRTKIQRRKDAETQKIKKANKTKARIQQQTEVEEERRTQKKKEERIKPEQDKTKKKHEQEQREQEIESEHKASEVAEAGWCEKVGGNKGSQRGSKEEALLLSGLAKR